MKRRGVLRIGTSGFHYNHWREIFYPGKLAKSEWFAYYARHFDTVEINNTFYRLPAAGVFDLWRRQAPSGFLYALKFNRYGSHWMRLAKAEATIGNFLKVASRLEQFLGPILVQLPPHWNINAARLDEFLAAAPRQFQWTVEFRNATWLCAEIYKVLERHGAALCIHDMIPGHPRIVTASFTYLRYHGQRYSGSYSPRQLAAESRWIRLQLAQGTNVFAYFNNDAQGFALKNAMELRKKVSGKRAPSVGTAELADSGADFYT
jgi:uncharacterized protein YecE (DUF72 family)